MGVGVLWGDLFRRKKGYSDLIGINRAFFMQGLLLVSVCRRLPDPEPGQVDAFKNVCNAVMAALQAGAEKDVEMVAELKRKVERKFENAKKLLCSYLDGNHISLAPIRGTGSKIDGKRLREEMVDAIKNDKAAMGALETLTAGFSAKMKEIKKLGKIGISVTYFPDLLLPAWDPTDRKSPFIISDKYTAPIYYAEGIFKVEERTTIELFLHRLLQYTTYDKNLDLLSLERRPELYKRWPHDSKHPEKSLLPLSTVDEYHKEGKALVLTIETEVNKTINVSNGKMISLPSMWRNIWIIEKDEWVMVRQGDLDFTLHKYTMAEFLKFLKPLLVMENNLYEIPNNTSQNQHTSYPHSYPSGTQPTFPQPYNGVPAPLMPLTSIQMPQSQHLVAPSVGQPPPIARADPAPLPHRPPPPHQASPPQHTAPSIGQRPPTTTSAGPAPSQSANTSKPPANRKQDTTRLNSAERAKMSIPDSSSATHHVAGEMKLVGREKKAPASGGGFFSRLFGRS
ncbi:hypothetical protein BJ912DRAFT_651498 [Pholiota molesta]|nr:hypothetical protein BJ912DRAFT_651498 [Pholiota molesta]